MIPLRAVRSEDADGAVSWRGEFTASQVLALTGITYRSLDYWCRAGLLSPDLTTRHGSGRYRTFTLDDVAVIDAAASLVDAGLTVRAAFAAAHAMHARHDLSARVRVGDYTITIERTTL